MQVGRTQGLDDPQSRVSAVVSRHGRLLMRVARQFSLCQDDAQDAYQRGLEIFVRRVATVDPATEVAWLKVVIRHEALAIRRARSESVTGEELDLDASVPEPDRSVEDQIAAGERVRRSAEALRALKPDEAQALMLKAHGLTYEEIGERNGWSYTKVNRAITEGRRRFMRVYEGIESGAECERFAPIVDALAAGQATSEQVLEIRPHLRHCSACRATVRDLHMSRLRRASLLWPLSILAAPLARAGSRDVPSLEKVLEIEPAHSDPGAFATIKQHVTAFLHRVGASDAATGVHIATSSGGGRISGLAAIVALCLSSLTAGTVCVVTGAAPPLLRDAPSKPSVQRTSRPSRRPPPSPHAAAPESLQAEPQFPLPAQQPKRFPAHHQRIQGRKRDAKPSRHADRSESEATTSQAPAREFGFEQAAVDPTNTSSQATIASPHTLAPSQPSTAARPAEREFNPAAQEFDP